MLSIRAGCLLFADHSCTADRQMVRRKSADGEHMLHTTDDVCCAAQSCGHWGWREREGSSKSESQASSKWCTSMREESPASPLCLKRRFKAHRMHLLERQCRIIVKCLLTSSSFTRASRDAVKEANA